MYEYWHVVVFVLVCTFSLRMLFSQGYRFSVIFRYFWPDPFSYFIFLFLNFLSLFVFNFL